jgi:serine phosphatase RsbU (regulator of sigma subunit)/ligand-binding sensor domain-containing protein
MILTFQRVRPIAYWLLSLLLACTSASSQPSNRQEIFRHLTVKEGLSQGSVNCILQDSKGFLWFGTQDGLNRFDGYDFRIYKNDPADPQSLNDNWVLMIAEDSAGTLWVRTRTNPDILDRFDRATETFIHVRRDSVDLTRARKNTVKAEWDEPSGIQWRGTIGGGLARYDPRSGATRPFKHDPKDPKSLIDDRVYSIFQDHQGVVWVGTKEGLDQYDPVTEAFTHYRHDDRDPTSLSDNWVWPILEDRTGVLWVGTFRGGLNRFDRQRQAFTHFRHDESKPQSPAGDQLLSLYQDRSGMIWVGMNDLGVDCFHPELNPFAHYAEDPLNPAGLSDNSILALYVGRSGSPWIATRKGVDLFDRSRGTFIHYRHGRTSASIGDDQAQCFLEDHTGALWIGFVNGGLDRFDPVAKTFSHFRHSPSDPRSLSDNRIYALAEGEDGQIWIGTYGGGLNRLDTRTGIFTRYVHNDSIPGSLGAEGVFALQPDRGGVLWVGTFGGGLDRFDIASGTFTHFKFNPADSGSLSNDVVACLHVTRAGILWVGTAGGLNKFDAATGKFKSYRERDGLPNDVVFGILEDGHGDLWMSTNKGISRFDPGREEFWNFNQSDGLQGDEFNQNAYARDPSTGEMYFGGSNGFNVFHPDSVRPNPYVPPIAFSSFIRYNSDDQAGKPIEGKGIDAREVITLSYKDNVATFQFAALSYYNRFKNRYAYRLEGYSDNWIQLGTERRATFTNLDGGEYTLRVKGSNNDGLWNEQGASLRLVVTPPWWRTRWAFGSYAVIVLALLFGIQRFEINRREQKAQIRESRLRAQAAEAEKRVLEVENERKTKELEAARDLQLSMLPQEVPKVPNYEIAVFMKTATEVGGDYYDFAMGADGELNIGFGDATGHGMQAGTIVTLIKGLFVTYAAQSQILLFFQECSRAIKEIRMGRLFMAFSLVRLKGNSVTFSTAGMPPLYHFRKEDHAVEEILLKGMPLGAMKRFPYVLHQLELRPGDVLLLLSDGLPEQKNSAGEMFDYRRIQDVFGAMADRAPDEIVRCLMEEGETWMKGVGQEDDVTLMAVKYKDNSGTVEL